MMNLILGMLCSYLVGSIPTAYIFGKLYKNLDIRQHGSGNVGATNVFRVLGKVPGVMVLLIDITKGLLAITVVANFFNLAGIVDFTILAVCVVGGHNWTVFLKFKGGKGIATTLGVLIGLTIQIPTLCPVLLGTLGVWLLCFLTTGFVSLASIMAAIALPCIMVITHKSIELIILGVIFCIFVVVRHRPNIKRLLAGQESHVRLPFHRK